MAKVGLETPAVTPLSASTLQLSALQVGADSGAVAKIDPKTAGADAPPPPSAIASALLALVNQLSPADRAALARVLAIPPGEPNSDTR
jgi:hypothetical protein